MAYTVIGRIRPRPMGAWSAEAAYEALDVVMHPDGAKAYMAIRDVPAGAALADGEYWAPVADVSAAVESIAAYREQLMCRVHGETETAHGTLVRMTPDAGSLVRAVSHMEPVQAGEGTPSPDNLRAISGRTGLRLVRCGRNLLENAEGTLTKNGVTFTVNADGSITANGTATADAPFVLVRNLALPDGAYVLSGCPNGGLATTFRLYAVSPSVSDYGNGATLAVNGTKPTVAIMIRKGYTADNLTFHPMLRPASDADATYAPYGGDTFAVGFGQTVYGGRLDWATGELTVTHGMIDAYAGESLPGEWISDRDAYAAGASPTTGAQVAYALSEPYVVRVAPQLIGAIDGENILYGDSEFDAEWVIPLKASIEAHTGALDTVSFEHITFPNSSTVSNDGTEITVLSYNVGVYNNGNTSKRGMAENVIDEKVFNIKKLLMDVNPYLIGLQEDIQYIDRGETKDAHEYLYKPIFPVRSTLGGTSVYSKKAFVNSGSRSIGNGRCMAWGEISVNGKTLLFISTHPSPDTTAHRLEEYQNIFSWTSQRTYEWCIIAGDFNTIEEQDRTNLKDICETNGFTMANGGYLGWLKTTPYPRSLDNILVSSKCIINSVKVHSSLENDLISDHYPLSAKITLLN